MPVLRSALGWQDWALWLVWAPSRPVLVAASSPAPLQPCPCGHDGAHGGPEVTGLIAIVLLARHETTQAALCHLHLPEKCKWSLAKDDPSPQQGRAVPCHTMPYHAMLYHAVPCHAVPCRAVPCCARSLLQRVRDVLVCRGSSTLRRLASARGHLRPPR